MFRYPNLSRTACRAVLASALMLPAAGLQAAGLSLAINARTAQEAQALHAAITLYAIHRDMRAGADIRQVGRNHLVRVSQSSGGNRGIIRQHGQGHQADLSQQGGHNAQVIVQYGRDARAQVHQTGGQAGILIQIAP